MYTVADFMLTAVYAAMFVCLLLAVVAFVGWLGNFGRG